MTKMKIEAFPTREELEQHASLMPEINPPAVLAMLRIMQAAEEIRCDINDVLEKKYQLSEGKLRVLIVLHQHPEGIAPSYLAEKTGVTKATISVMSQRLVRDGLVEARSSQEDRRTKKLLLTPAGKAYTEKVLPGHYLRITKLMGRLTEQEQNELIGLLKKLTG
jgi:DNA-binding MarR family transcriptional regulator